MILRFLAFLDRHGASLLASGLAIGLAAPALASWLRPLLEPMIFVLTTATLLRIQWPQVFVHARRPGRLALALGWSLGLSPVLAAAAARALGLPEGLAQALVLWAASPPLISLPAIAFLMGLDGALALVVMAGGTLLIPVTLPPLVLGLIELKLGIGITALMGRLALFVAGAVALSGLVRWLLGAERLRRRAAEISGITVLCLLLFAIAVMDGMQTAILERPGAVAFYAGTALGASLALQAASFLAFSWLDRLSQLTLALTGGNKNMAIVWASLGAAAASRDIMLFFACVQLPIYLLPAALGPVYRRLGAEAPR